MELIPFINIEKNQIFTNDDVDVSVAEIKNLAAKDSVLYVYDHEGIDDNRPDLNMLQLLATEYILWVDAGPRTIDDVVDLVTAGASTITLRKNLWPKLDIPGIREITEGELYLESDPVQVDRLVEVSLYPEILGLVYFKNNPQLMEQLKYESTLKKMLQKNKMYTYESDPRNALFWKENSITGLLVDILHLKEYT